VMCRLVSASSSNSLEKDEHFGLSLKGQAFSFARWRS